MDRYLVISSDTHAGPPSAAYRDYVDPQYREAFDEDLATAAALRSVILESASEEQERFREEWEEETGDGGKLASYDPAARNAELDKEGIAAEVIFPDADVLGGGASAPFSAGLQSSGELDGELVMAGARAHNRWLAELCSDSPERRCGVATVPILHDIPAAVEEMHRVADAGLRADDDPHVVGHQARVPRPGLRAGVGGRRRSRPGREHPFGRIVEGHPARPRHGARSTPPRRGGGRPDRSGCCCGAACSTAIPVCGSR